jgi:hypothetical protein
VDEQGTKPSVRDDPAETLLERSAGTGDRDTDDLARDVEDLPLRFELDRGGDRVVSVREKGEGFLNHAGREKGSERDKGNVSLLSSKS